MHGASLLRELIALLPPEQLHAKKKLIAIDATANGVEISFADGSTGVFDAVIGADGIFSSVRNYVPQDAEQTFAASPAGFVRIHGGSAFHACST